MTKTDIKENYFKILTLIFWPIIWYKWIFISSRKLEIFLFSVYSFIAALYIIYFIYIYINTESEEKTSLMFAYRMSTVVTFIITLISFVLFPKSIPFLYMKLLAMAVYFYFSYREVYKKKNPEGVVGLMSCLLLLVFTIFY